MDAIEELNSRGFKLDFNLRKDDIKKNPGNYEIIHIYRYEGESDPGDEATVYGIAHNQGAKGIFIQGYSASAVNEESDTLKGVKIVGRDM